MAFNKKSRSILYNKQFHFQLVMIALCCVNMFYMHYSILTDRMDLGKFPYLQNACFTISDILFLFVVPLLLIKKKSYLHFIPYTLVSVLVLANVWYSRYFYTYIAPALYLEFKNVNELSDNIYSIIEYSDLIIVITSLIAIVYYIKFHKQFKDIQRKERAYLSIIALASGVTIVVGMFISHYIINSKYFTVTTDILKEDFYYSYKYSNTENTFKYGMWYSLTVQFIMSENKTYSKEKLKELQPLIHGIVNKTATRPPKNLILIIVESLLSYPTHRSVNGIEITPILNKLVQEGAYYNGKMESQIQLGESSDGQMIYLTGLLPKEKQITILDYFNNTFLALPQLLKEQNRHFHSNMIIPTSAQIWRQDGMCIKYGFDSLFSKKEYKGEVTHKWLNDKELFEYATSKIDSTNSPSFTVVLTSSTHSPYYRFYEPGNITLPANYSTEFKSYLSNVHYMDKYLGIFLESLKEKGAYDNSLIIITSDHGIHHEMLNPQEIEIANTLPLYIVNAPVEIHKSADLPITQADLFPTILDLMNIKSKWRGIGNSLLTPDSILNSKREKDRNRKGRQISDIILDSNYFKTTNSR